MSKRLVYVLPRIQVVPNQYGRHDLRLGKAVFLLDADATWNDWLHKPRPLCLDIFRDFPYEPGEEAPVARGTVLVSEDESWLRDNVAYVVAVAYVLGVQENLWQHPAEAFHYYDLLVGEDVHDLVKFHTKTHGLTEDASFQLLPALELRGVTRPFLIDVQSDIFSELSKRLEQAVPDRLVASCYHLFRTQFANGFLAPTLQDYAAFCACLEAAFDVPKSQEGGKTLADAVEGFYGGYQGLRDFIRGLYEERSVFNHGVSTATLEQHRQALIQSFRRTPFRWDLLRHICLDVIAEKVREALGTPRGDIGMFFSTSFKMVEKVFSSKDAWTDLCNELTKKGSVKTLLSLHQTGNTEQDDSKLSAFIGLSCRLLLVHEWSGNDRATEANKACAALGCLAEIIDAVSIDGDVKASAVRLYQAARAKEADSLGTWAAEHKQWTMLRGYDGLCDAAQAVAAHIADLFDEI